jgi:hypothetical protein
MITGEGKPPRLAAHHTLQEGVMGLEVCSSGHEEIAYNEEYRGGRRTKCPLCATIEAMDKFRTDLDSIVGWNPNTEASEAAREDADDYWRDAIKAATP